MKIKLNTDLLGYTAGRTIEVKANRGIPLDKFWRNRLKDAKIDNCIEIVKTSSKKATSKKENKE